MSPEGVGNYKEEHSCSYWNVPVKVKGCCLPPVPFSGTVRGKKAARAIRRGTAKDGPNNQDN